MRALLATFLLNVSGFTTCGPLRSTVTTLSSLKALYVAANLAPIAVEGISASVRGVASRREGKVGGDITEAAQSLAGRVRSGGRSF